MNKEIFSRYGSIIAMVLVLAVMITFAAPFGNAITSGVNNFVNGFGNAMNGNAGGGGGSGSSGIKLDAPTNLTLANNQLSFDLVPNANQYILYVNDEVSATYATSPIDVNTYIETYGTPITFKLVASDSTGAYGNSTATEYIAAGDGKMILKAGTYRFNDDIYIGYESIDGTYDLNFTSYNDVGVTTSYDGIYGDAVVLEFHSPNGTDNWLQVWADTVGWLDDNFRVIIISDDQTVADTFGTWFISNTNYNEVNGGTGDEDSVLGLRRFKENATTITTIDTSVDDVVTSLDLISFTIEPITVDGITVSKLTCACNLYDGAETAGPYVGLYCDDADWELAPLELFIEYIEQFNILSTANATVDEWLLANTTSAYTFCDLIVRNGSEVISLYQAYSEAGIGCYFYEFETRPTENIMESEPNYHLYYIKSENAVLVYNAGNWYTLEQLFELPFNGEILDAAEAVEDGFYVLMGEARNQESTQLQWVFDEILDLNGITETTGFTQAAPLICEGVHYDGFGFLYLCGMEGDDGRLRNMVAVIFLKADENGDLVMEAIAGATSYDDETGEIYKCEWTTSRVITFDTAPQFLNTEVGLVFQHYARPLEDDEIVSDNGIVGWWLLNDNISLPSSSSDLALHFYCDGIEYTKIDNSYDDEMFYYGYIDGVTNNTNVYSVAGGTGWKNEKYKLIQVIEGSSDPYAKSWLEANAKRVISVDELPAEGVNENAIYRVEEIIEDANKDVLVGTWVFTDTSAYNSGMVWEYEGINQIISVNFTSGGKTFSSIVFQDPSSYSKYLGFHNGEEWFSPTFKDLTYCDCAYHTIEFLNEPTEYNEFLLFIMNSIATKGVPVFRYYQYINKTWVEL